MTTIIICIAAFIVACIVADLLIYSMAEEGSERVFWMVGTNVLFFIITAVIFSIIFFHVDNKEAQEKWIAKELPLRIWDQQVEDMTDEKYRQVYYMLEKQSEEAAKKYSTGEKESSKEMHLIASLFGAGEIFSLLDNTDSRIESQINSYDKHFSSVLNTLGQYMAHYANTLKDERLKKVPAYSNSDIFDLLIGPPGNMANPSYYTIEQISYSLVNNMLAGARKPSVASSEYNYLDKCWSVRMDNAPNEIVRFYRRSDGRFEVSWDGNKEIVEFSEKQSEESTSLKARSADTGKKAVREKGKSSTSGHDYSYKGSFKSDKGVALNVEMTLIIQQKENKDGTLPVSGSYRYLKGKYTTGIEFTGTLDPISNKLILLTDNGTEKFNLKLNKSKGVSGTKYKYKNKSDRDKGTNCTNEYKVDLKAV